MALVAVNTGKNMVGRSSVGVKEYFRYLNNIFYHFLKSNIPLTWWNAHTHIYEWSGDIKDLQVNP